MKFVPPTEARLQCPECGVPVEWLESVPPIGSVRLGPCEHSMSVEALGLFPAKVKPGPFPIPTRLEEGT